jgi:hypothetical protein
MTESSPYLSFENFQTYLRKVYRIDYLTPKMSKKLSTAYFQYIGFKNWNPHLTVTVDMLNADQLRKMHLTAGPHFYTVLKAYETLHGPLFEEVAK